MHGAGGWLQMIVYWVRKVLLAGCWWLVWGCSTGRFSAYLDLFRLISSHITLFNLSVKHYSSYQPNSPFVLREKYWQPKRTACQCKFFYYSLVASSPFFCKPNIHNTNFYHLLDFSEPNL
jgi:hypothetical protein